MIFHIGETVRFVTRECGGQTGKILTIYPRRKEYDIGQSFIQWRIKEEDIIEVVSEKERAMPFHLGQTVRVNFPGLEHHGREGKIKSLSSDFYTVKFLDPPGEGNYEGGSLIVVESTAPFKINEKVKVNRPGDKFHGTKGNVLTVSTGGLCRIAFDEVVDGMGRAYIDAKYLERVPNLYPMTQEEKDEVATKLLGPDVSAKDPTPKYGVGEEITFTIPHGSRRGMYDGTIFEVRKASIDPEPSYVVRFFDGSDHSNVVIQEEDIRSRGRPTPPVNDPEEEPKKKITDPALVREEESEMEPEETEATEYEATVRVAIELLEDCLLEGNADPKEAPTPTDKIRLRQVQSLCDDAKYPDDEIPF